MIYRTSRMNDSVALPTIPVKQNVDKGQYKKSLNYY